MSSPLLGPVGVQVPSTTWGRGYTSTRTLPTPAAGQGVSYRVPSPSWQIPLALRCQLATSAVVANRFPVLSYAQGDGSPIASFYASTAIVASQTAQLTWALGANIPGGAAGLAPTIPLAEMILQAGWQILLSVTGIDVADAITAVWLTTLHIPTGPQGPPSGAFPVADTAGQYGGGSVEVDVYTS